MQINVNDVVIKHRIRVNLGNLTQLMESMRRHGLMNPILITQNKELIAGNRRLESAKRLGWTTIEARIIDSLDEADKVEMEIDENLHRRSLSPDELADGYARLTRLKNPGFFRRIWQKIRDLFRRILRR
jgi:ParB family transcriptional regulator, chromosome partitioning protein